MKDNNQDKESGQSLVEFALIVPVLLLLICGVLDFGKILYTYMNMNMTVQEAVRLGGLGASDSAIVTYAKEYIHPTNPDLLEVVISPLESERDSGGNITVTLRTPYQFITPVISNVFSESFQISADSTIRVE